MLEKTSTSISAVASSGKKTDIEKPSARQGLPKNTCMVLTILCWPLMQGCIAKTLIIQYKTDKNLSKRDILDWWKFCHGLDPVIGHEMEEIPTDF